MFYCTLAYVCSTVDTSTSHQISFQKECLFKLLGISRNERFAKTLIEMGLCDNETQVLNPCDWNGIQCDEGIINDMNWGGMWNAYIAFHIEWIPSTVRMLNMDGVWVRSSIETRFLPAKMYFCSMDKCQIHGSINLKTLPSCLEEILMRNNQIKGTVRLTDLPKGICKIDLSNNPIKAVIVSQVKLPHALKYAHFHNPQKKVKIISLDSKYPDIRVNASVMNSTLFDLYSEHYSCEVITHVSDSSS